MENHDKGNNNKWLVSMQQPPAVSWSWTI